MAGIRTGARGRVLVIGAAALGLALASACATEGSTEIGARGEPTTERAARTTTTTAIRVSAPPTTATREEPPATTTPTTPPPPPTAPPTVPPPPPTTPPPPRPPRPAAGTCHPSYTPCVPMAEDVDCQGGSGNGPVYVGRVTVIGPDVYDLDRDGDGIGCE
jgi:hypothetical protein